jgi:hypothetical protein
MKQMASPAPWRHAEEVIRDQGGRVVARTGSAPHAVTFQNQADGELVVALRNLAPEIDALLDDLIGTIDARQSVIERLTARVRRLEAQRYGA